MSQEAENQPKSYESQRFPEQIIKVPSEPIQFGEQQFYVYAREIHYDLLRRDTEYFLLSIDPKSKKVKSHSSSQTLADLVQDLIDGYLIEYEENGQKYSKSHSNTRIILSPLEKSRLDDFSQFPYISIQDNEMIGSELSVSVMRDLSVEEMRNLAQEIIKYTQEKGITFLRTSGSV